MSEGACERDSADMCLTSHITDIDLNITAPLS